MMRTCFFILLGVFFSLTARSAITVTGSSVAPLSYKAEAATGLNEIIVIYDAGGVSLTYESEENRQPVVWMRYGNMGGGYAEVISDVRYDGNRSSVAAARDDSGYLIEDGDKRYYFWVVNYSNHYYQAQGLSAAADSDCGYMNLHFDGKASPIHYYGINGRQFELSRELSITYRTLVYNQDNNIYRQETVARTVNSIADNTLHITAPLCDTEVTLSGDRFLKAWGYEETVSSPTLTAIAVEATTSAVQTERDVPNEKHSEGADGELGGSAPCEIEFTAVVTDAAIFTEWQFSRSREFEDIDMRVNDLQTVYTFRDEGTTYVRFMCADASGVCEYFSDTYTVNIGTSMLNCPNAFSPGVSEGVNDEWRVSYRSIVSFECHIFNRWGTKMASLTDPSQGWDGRYGGKIVPAGVYFYVIKARGADGKEYKLSGDINVVNYE